MSTTPDNSSRWCPWCLVLSVKHRFPWNGDWLFVTTGKQCTKHRVGRCKAEAPNDLSTEFDTFEKAHDTFVKTEGVENRKLLYEQAQKWESDVDSIATIQREKAKTLVGMASFTFSIFLAIATLIISSLDRLPLWALIIEVALLFLSGSQLFRALTVAIKTMIREVGVRPSMQDVAQSLAVDDRDEVGSRLVELSAHIVSAANRHHEHVRKDRVNKNIIAMHSFLWGVRILAFFVGAHFVFMLIQPATMNKDLLNRVKQIETSVRMVDRLSKSRAETQDLRHSENIDRIESRLDGFEAEVNDLRCSCCKQKADE